MRAFGIDSTICEEGRGVLIESKDVRVAARREPHAVRVRASTRRVRPPPINLQTGRIRGREVERVN